jgi:hypothetical protein
MSCCKALEEETERAGSTGNCDITNQPDEKHRDEGYLFSSNVSDFLAPGNGG